MSASWVDAVREYAKQTGKWNVPKKGTPEYDAVKALQDKLKAGPIKKEEPKKEEPKRLGRKAKVVEEAPVVEAVAPVKKEKKVAEAPKQEVAPTEAPQKKRGLKKVAPVEAPKQAPIQPAQDEPMVQAKPRVKRSLREPRVTIEDKKVILNFD